MTLLSQHTTLGLGGPARHFVAAASELTLLDAVRHADMVGEQVLILGGGSNLVISDDGFAGTVVHVDTRGMSYARTSRGVRAGGYGGGTAGKRSAPPGDDRRGVRGVRGVAPPGGDARVEVTVAAGENWDDIVAATVAEGLAGLECLSGIPGRAGATPIQNVGAYGQEVAEVITDVHVLDRKTISAHRLSNGDCKFAYRTSMFKQEPGRYVVIGVTFALHDEKLSRPVRYAELARELGVELGDRVPCADAREAVLAIRGRKGMVVRPDDPDSRSVGSFFTNPIVDTKRLTHVEAVAADRGLGPVPRFDAGGGLVKIPAAWLIERSGFAKGHGDPVAAHVSSKHTLALVNGGAATTAGLLALAREIVAGVKAAFGVTLEPEPILVGVTL